MNTPTSTPTNTPATTPTSTPVPLPIALSNNHPAAGGSITVTGSVPTAGQTYCLCMVADAPYTVGSPYAVGCLVSTQIVPPTTSYSAAVGPIPAGGPFRILLLDGPCSRTASHVGVGTEGTYSLTILAVSDTFDTGGDNTIPALGGYGLFVFLGLVGASGFLLVRRFQ